MTQYLDLETAEQDLDLPVFDVVIVGAGAAGLTIARELGSKGVRTCAIESGALEESPEHEALNAVEVDGFLLDPEVQRLRNAWHSWQLRYWSSDTQRYGVRTRVFGGSTAAWAGRAAPFDPIDFKARPWIAESGWPISHDELDPFIARAATTLNLGPMINDRKFWSSTNREVPKPVQLLTHFDSFFWQFAKSSYELTRIKHFGWDFQRETFASVTVLLNATAASLKVTNGRASGVSLVSSKSARKFEVDAPIVVVAAGAVENARLLLLSGLSEPDATAPAGRPAIGRYLIDHPAARLGAFGPVNCEKAFRLLGFHGVPSNGRVYMYSHGLALRPEAQEEFALPNLAAIAVPRLAADDPLSALKRLARRKTDRPLRDIKAVVCNVGLVVTFLGRKALEHPKIPLGVRRRLIDVVVRANPNMVALDYLSSGRSQKLDDLTVELLVEQPPERENVVRLSEARDRLGLRKAEVRWQVSLPVRESIIRAGNLLVADLRRAGFEDFRTAAPFASNSAADLVTWDMGHTAGTTRMGADPETSVVDKDCQVHGVEGLYVAGASTFPTIGHANPTLVIVAMAIRVADRLVSLVASRRAATGSTSNAADNSGKPLVLVTGATGHLGREVINALCDKGYRVRAQYRNRPPDDGRVDWVRMDFADPDLPPDALDGLVAGADAVIHLAASLANAPDEMETTNVVNLERLADACARNGVRYFGQASSMVVYGSLRFSTCPAHSKSSSPPIPTSEIMREASGRVRIFSPVMAIGCTWTCAGFPWPTRALSRIACPGAVSAGCIPSTGTPILCRRRLLPTPSCTLWSVHFRRNPKALKPTTSVTAIPRRSLLSTGARDGPRGCMSLG